MTPATMPTEQQILAAIRSIFYVMAKMRHPPFSWQLAKLYLQDMDQLHKHFSPDAVDTARITRIRYALPHIPPVRGIDKDDLALLQQAVAAHDEEKEQDHARRTGEETIRQTPHAQHSRPRARSRKR